MSYEYLHQEKNSGMKNIIYLGVHSETDNIFHSTIFYNIMCLATVIYSTKRDKYKNNGI